MTRLFIELYLDEDVDILLADLLRHRGFTVTTTRDVDQLHLDDRGQLSLATNRGWTIFTHNRVDFEALATEDVIAGRSHAGIIIATRRRPHDLLRRLLLLLNTLTTDEMTDQVRYI